MNARLRLDDPVGRIKGVGPARAAGFAAAGIETVEDLLLYLPFRYEDRSDVVAVAELVAGRRCGLQIEVERRRLVRRGRDSRVVATVRDDTGAVSVVWFRQPYVADAIGVGDRLWLYGPVTEHDGTLQLVNPIFEKIPVAGTVVGEHGDGEHGDGEHGDGCAADRHAADRGLHVGRLVPIYRRIGKLTPGLLRRIIDTVLSSLAEAPETLPAPTLARLDLVGREEALRMVHDPPADAVPAVWNAARSAAHRRLICEEFVAFQTALQRQRPRGTGSEPCVVVEVESTVVDELLAWLPFSLTLGQGEALRQVLDDMAAPAPMHRLLQGDVGCGKTAVAGCAMLVAARAGLQAAMMAPTEILARQHVASLAPWAQAQGLAIGLLTGSQPRDARRKLLADLEGGALRLVVGTHALIEPAVRFARLGLAVVDEQHRFGVRQRAALRDKGRGAGPQSDRTAVSCPDLLVMTATPIPRSLALTAYGDLDLCTIDDMPPGRQPIRSLVVPAEEWGRVTALLSETVARGEQAYVVAPRIESGDDELEAAVRLRGELSRQLPGARVGLVHGAQPAEERLAAMEAFVDGSTDVLSATTVVEVGVDVANATLMVVGHCERFGLAQLHQLRGRVGRGGGASTCVFLAHEPLSRAARARMEAIAGTDDGFLLAEKDLHLRGPGEVLGTRQAGVAGLRVGDPFRDHAWLEEARREAMRLVDAEDPQSVAYRGLVESYWRRRFVAMRAG